MKIESKFWDDKTSKILDDDKIASWVRKQLEFQMLFLAVQNYNHSLKKSDLLYFLTVDFDHPVKKKVKEKEEAINDFYIGPNNRKAFLLELKNLKDEDHATLYNIMCRMGEAYYRTNRESY